MMSSFALIFRRHFQELFSSVMKLAVDPVFAFIVGQVLSVYSSSSFILHKFISHFLILFG